jgi:hypothetical protein
MIICFQREEKTERGDLLHQTPLTLFATVSRIFPQEYSFFIFPLNLQPINMK